MGKRTSSGIINDMTNALQSKITRNTHIVGLAGFIYSLWLGKNTHHRELRASQQKGVRKPFIGDGLWVDNLGRIWGSKALFWVRCCQEAGGNCMMISVNLICKAG